MLNRKTVSQYIRPLFPLPTSYTKRGALDKKVKCILFDIYGTLFISGSGDINIEKSSSPNLSKLKKLLSEYGVSRPPRSLLIDLFKSITKKHNQDKQKGVDYPEVQIDRIWMNVLGIENPLRARNFAVKFELITNPVYPMPFLKEMLSAFKVKNIPMGIISNAQFYTPYLFNWFLHSDLNRLGFDPDLIFLSYRFGYAKPSMFLFENASKILCKKNISLDSVLYIGNDMLNDILPARCTGFQTALFAGDARSLKLRDDDERCKDLKPDLIVTDLMQLVDAVFHLV